MHIGARAGAFLWQRITDCGPLRNRLAGASAPFWSALPRPPPRLVSRGRAASGDGTEIATAGPFARSGEIVASMCEGSWLTSPKPDQARVKAGLRRLSGACRRTGLLP